VWLKANPNWQIGVYLEDTVLYNRIIDYFSGDEPNLPSILWQLLQQRVNRDEIMRTAKVSPAALKRWEDLVRSGQLNAAEISFLQRYPGLIPLLLDAGRGIFYALVPRADEPTGWGAMNFADFVIAVAISARSEGLRPVIGKPDVQRDRILGIIYRPATTAALFLNAWDDLGERTQVALANVGLTKKKLNQIAQAQEVSGLLEAMDHFIKEIIVSEICSL